MARPRTPSRKLTPNFNLNEFHCSDGTAVPSALVPNVEKLATALQVLRDHIGKPIRITSGYRTPTYNERIGGKKASYHLKAMAADFKVEGMTPRVLASKIESLIAQGRMPAGGLGVYASFVHYDTRGRNNRW